MALMASNFKFDISNLKYPGIYVHVASNSHLGGLRGYDSLEMSPEVTYDPIFETFDFNYPCSQVYLASKCFDELLYSAKA